MHEQLEPPDEDFKSFRRCIDDLGSILTLPALWNGGGPAQIVRTLLDALLDLLSLEFVYVRLKNRDGEVPIEMVRVMQSQELTERAHQIGEEFSTWLGDDPRKWPRWVKNPLRDGNIAIVPLRLGLQGELGAVVAGAQRADFPRHAESVLLNVATNLAALALQKARLLSEQKRVADEHDKRVAERTAELAAANEELKREIAELKEGSAGHEERELKRSEARKAVTCRHSSVHG